MLADHVLRSDEEILGLCGINLVFLDYTTSGIIKNIHAPNPNDTKKTPAPTPAHKKSSKTTCRDSTKKPTKQSGPKLNTTCGKRSRTLSESRQEILGLCSINLVFLDYTTYGIIKNIRAPNPNDTKKTPAPTPAHKKSSKTTCRDSTKKANETIRTKTQHHTW